MHFWAQIVAAQPSGFLQNALAYVVAIVVGTGAIGVVLGLVLRGGWAKMGEPVVKNMFLAWYRDPDQQDKRKKEIKDVIDDQLQRADGLIRKEIASQVDTMQKELAEVITQFGTEFRQEVRELKEILGNQDETSEAFRTNIMTRLGKIEGAVNVMTKGQLSGTSESGFPAQPNPFPGQRRK
jgi:hypothetical protein